MNIEIIDLTYIYPGSKEKVFSNYNLTLKPGITLLKGFSGCGKSTLLRIIASLLNPTKGKIYTTSVHKFGSPIFLRNEVGFVFQQFNLLPLATIRRNISLASDLAGLHKSSAKEWLDALGLEKLANKKPIQLSGGQQQRAAIARALAKNPSIILLDEPTSGLDDLNTMVIVNALREKISSDAICLIATHDQRLENFADEILNFNSFLSVEKHLQKMVRKPNFTDK